VTIFNYKSIWLLFYQHNEPCVNPRITLSRCGHKSSFTDHLKWATTNDKNIPNEVFQLTTLSNYRRSNINEVVDECALNCNCNTFTRCVQYI